MSHRARPLVRLAVLSIAVVAALLAVIWASPPTAAPAAQSGLPPAASMSLAKVCSPEAAVGGLVQYTITVTNTGGQGLDRDSVIDSPNLGDLTSSFSAHLDPSQSDQVVKFYIVQESDPRPLVNTVTATYVSDDGTVLVLDVTCSVDVPHLTITKTATFNPGGPTTLTFTLTNDGTEPVRRFIVLDSVLGDITSQFPFQLAVGDTVVVQITVPGEVCENTVTAVYQSVPRSSTVTATAECGRDERGGLEIVQNNPDGTLFTDATVTFHICLGVVVLCDAGNAGITTTSNPSGLIFLDAGTYTVCVEEPAGFVVDPPACQTPVVTLGGTVSVVFITRPEDGNGGGTFPTDTDCTTFNDGSATPLNEIRYSLSRGDIHRNVSPGVFFYFSKFTIASAGALSIVQDENETGDPAVDYRFRVHRDFAKLFDGNCNPIDDLTVEANDIDVTGQLAAGTYIVQIKYDSKSIVGFPEPSPTTVHYTFQTFVGLTLVDEDADGLDLVPK